MHESLMSVAERERLRDDVDAFYRKYVGLPVSIEHAKEWFESRGYALTRPLWQTLEAHGCIVRTSHGRAWPYPMRGRPWVYDHVLDALRPAELPMSGAA